VGAGKFGVDIVTRTSITGQYLTGERAAFALENAQIDDTVFAEGESPLKHAAGLDVQRTVFEWKYPLWYSRDVTLSDSALLETARSGPWYVQGLTLRRVLVASPKTFRHSSGLLFEDVQFPDAQETLWWCDDVRLNHVSARGDYFGMNSSHIVADDLSISGNYAFDGGHDIEVSNAKLLSRDAFWNCHDVVVRDSILIGEYLGWNSRNVTFINCVIESLQGLCYIDNLVMKGCRLLNTTLAFEYSTVDAELVGGVDSIFNPTSGTIIADSVGQITLDPDRIDPAATKIVLRGQEDGI